MVRLSSSGCDVIGECNITSLVIGMSLMMRCCPNKNKVITPKFVGSGDDRRQLQYVAMLFLAGPWQSSLSFAAGGR